MSGTDLFERRETLLGPAYKLFYEKPLHLVRGEGVWLFDAHGRHSLGTAIRVSSRQFVNRPASSIRTPVTCTKTS
jgi:4-aminobutyrate aminotransferase-like enzyme